MITRNGKTVAELVPPKPSADIPDTLVGLDWARMERVRNELGVDRYDGPPLDDKWLDEFGDAAWSRALFGLDDDRDPGGA